MRCYRILFKSVVTLEFKGVGNLPRKTELKLYFELGVIERWLPRPAEAGEGPEEVQRIRRLGVSMGENAPSGREKLGGRMRN